MPYLQTTTDEFLEIACESIFASRKKRTVADLLGRARKTLNRKLKTVADCDDYMTAIRSESTKFNECLMTLNSAKKKYDAGKLSPKDFDETLKSATMLLNKNCKMLQVTLGNFVDDKKAITSDEIAAFKEYVKGLGTIVKEIKAQRKKEAAMESAVEDDFDFDIGEYEMDADFAMEATDCDPDDKKCDKKSKDDEEDEEDEDDEKKSKKSSKKSKDDDDTEEDDDSDKDDKKSKDDDLEFDSDDFDFDDDSDDKDDKDDKKSSKKSDDEDEDESEDEEDDKDDKNSKKSSKKSKDDDDEDEEEDDEDDEKKSKSAKESAYNLFDFDDDFDD